MKKTAFFILAVVISFIAATYRWNDSAHSIGVIKAGGGEAKHPAVLESGKDGYMLIATAAVIPPYRGNVRVCLEGEPKIEHKLSLSNPVIDLGLRRHPELAGNLLYDLRPRDRIALWVDMKPPAVDPVCGMGHQEGFIKHRHAGKDYYFCSSDCVSAFQKRPDKFKDKDGVRGKYALAFYDDKTGNQVLNVPIIFKGKGGKSDAGEHHH